MAKKSAKSKGYRKQTGKKPYLSRKEIAAVCVIAALLAIGAFFLFRYDDGALKVQDGAVVVDGDNWLIADGSNVRGRARYFRLGEIGEIDGYSREKNALATDANLPEYVFTPAADGTGDLTVTVTCGHGSAEAMAKYTQSVLAGSEAATAGEIQTAELASQPVRWYSYVTEAAANSSEEMPEPADASTAEEASEPADATEVKGFTRSLAGYIDAPHECCVIVNAVSRGDTEADCLTEDALLAVLEKAVGAVRVDAAK